jgi:hypothetical protein
MRKFIFLLNIVFFSSLLPIKEETAKNIGLGVGAGAGIVSFWGSYSKFKNNVYYNDGERAVALFKSLLVGSGLGLLGGYIAYKIAMYNTPTKRFNRAQKIVDRVRLNGLVSKKFSRDRDFIKYCFSAFNSNWPLVDSRNELNSLRLDLIEARFLLSSFISESGGDSKYSYMRKEYKSLNEDISTFLPRITDRMYVLVSNSLYNEQLKVQQQYLREQRRRQERWQDRWEKQREKQKDRELLQNLAGNRPVNTNVNFNLG